MAIEKYIQTQWSIENVFDGMSVKTASFQPGIFVPEEIERYIGELEPDPRCSYVHVIAMSDGGTYGSNLNGDIFTADELCGMQGPDEAAKNPGDMRGIAVPRFKTFEQAKFYRNHDNGANSQFYGDVPVAAWNEPMRRVELIIRVFKVPMPGMGPNCRGAPDIVVKLDKRGYICVSMGTRIDHEECTVCHNQNAYVSQRCDCLRNHMNEVLSDGRKVAALNFKTRFFDISDVEIPADPIAYSLQKVASAGGIVPVNTAADVPVLDVVWTQKTASLTKYTPTAETTVGDHSDPAKPREQGELSKTLTEVAHHAIKHAAASATSLDQLVSTAAAAGVVLSPQELMLATACMEQPKLASMEMTEFAGFRAIDVTDVSPRVLDALNPIIAARSGFKHAAFAADWTEEALVDAGFPDIGAYYAHYREALRAIPAQTFAKVAHRNPHIRELLGNEPDAQYARIRSALHNLADAGMPLA